MKRINIFATGSDLPLVLGPVEQTRPLQYVLMGPVRRARPEIFNSCSNLPSLGVATGDQAVACDASLIMDRATQLHLWQMQMRNGAWRMDVDQRLNPDSVVLFPGGRCGNNVHISGNITTLSDSPAAQSLMRALHKGVKKDFTRIQAYWVGPEAVNAFRRGERLTMGVQCPSEYDLRDAVTDDHEP